MHRHGRLTLLPLTCLATLLVPALASASDASAPLGLVHRDSNVTTEPVEEASAEPSTEGPADDTTSGEASVGASLGGGAAAGAAAAAAGSSKTFRINVDYELMGLAYANPREVGDFTYELPNRVSFGLGSGRTGVNGAQQSLGQPSANLFSPLASVNLGLGYLINAQMVAGAYIFMGGQTNSSSEDDDAGPLGDVLTTRSRTSAFAGGLTPYFHYVFNASGPIRPFAEARFGFVGTRVWNREQITLDGDSSFFSKTVAEAITPHVGLQGGVHLFLSDTVSIMAGLSFDYFAPYARAVKTVADVDGDGDMPQETTKFDGDLEKQSNNINLGIPIGISIWM